MKLELNISPCPNDTFTFDALINKRIDTGGFEFNVSFADIEQLNNGVMAGWPLVSKISCAVLPQIADRYSVLDSGAALGYGNGPLLVGRENIDLSDPSLRIAVPGMHTTANALMSTIFPQLENKTALLFSEIADAVAAGRFDAGVLIHEGRFTYADKGLQLAADLGKEWDKLTGLPLPLGCIVVSRQLPEDVRVLLGKLLKESIGFAFECPTASEEFVRSHAQELSDKVIKDHIAMFVNDYSISLGHEGRRAVKELAGLGDEIFV